MVGIASIFPVYNMARYLSNLFPLLATLNLIQETHSWRHSEQVTDPWTHSSRLLGSSFYFFMSDRASSKNAIFENYLFSKVESRVNLVEETDNPWVWSDFSSQVYTTNFLSSNRCTSTGCLWINVATCRLADSVVCSAAFHYPGGDMKLCFIDPTEAICRFVVVVVIILCQLRFN